MVGVVHVGDTAKATENEAVESCEGRGGLSVACLKLGGFWMAEDAGAVQRGAVAVLQVLKRRGSGVLMQGVIFVAEGRSSLAHGLATNCMRHSRRSWHVSPAEAYPSCLPALGAVRLLKPWRCSP